MADDLDLSALASGPAPDLAPASAVRARGEQRTRRTRALLAGSAALLVLAGAGTAIALAGGGKPQSLQIANTPTPSATASPQTTPLDPARYVLTAEDAGTAAGGVWLAEQVVDEPALPLTVCPTGDGYAGAGARRTLRRGADHVLSGVVVQSDAARWVDGIRQDVTDCPRRAADSEDGRASDSFTLLSSESADDYVIVRDDYRDCDTCTPVVHVWLVVSLGELLSYTSLPDAELPRVGQWIDVMRDRLADPGSITTGASPTATPETNADYGDLSSDDLLQIDRIGPVRVGMTLDEARAAAGQELRQQGDVMGNCVYYAPRSKDPDVSFMVIDGVLSRIDVDRGGTSTQEGIAIGASEADVERTYPSTTVSKHYYTEGHYLRVLSDDGSSAYLFETDGTKVTRFRSGIPSAIDRVEGCA